MSDQQIKNISDDGDPGESTGLMRVEESRGIATINIAMMKADQRPRDINRAINGIIEECKRLQLAKTSQYSFPRGKTTVTGPSIELAKVIVRHWRNIFPDWQVIRQDERESWVRIIVWDMESNVPTGRLIKVSHFYKANEQIKLLTDPRDIQMHIAKEAHKNLRALIFQLIPGYIVDIAVEQCNKTLEGESGTPLLDRIRNLIEIFAKYGVTLEMIETRVGKNADKISEIEYANLWKIGCSIKDGESEVEQWFKKPESSSAVEDALEKKKAAKKPPVAAEPKPAEKTTPSDPPETPAPEQPPKLDADSIQILNSMIAAKNCQKQVDDYLKGVGLPKIEDLTTTQCMQLAGMLDGISDTSAKPAAEKKPVSNPKMSL